MFYERKPPLRVAVRISKSKFFIFCVCRLIQKDLSRQFVFEDLLDFLDTNRRELKTCWVKPVWTFSPKRE